MLRKRTRSVQKDQHKMNQLRNAPCSGSEFHPISSSLFNQLFTGLSPKVLPLPDSDSAKSPKSPLDYWVFPSLGNTSIRSPRSPIAGYRRNWDSSKVGLGIIDSLDDIKSSGKVLRSSNSKTILFGPKSLPKSYAISPPSEIESPRSDVVFEIREFPSESEPPGKNYSSSFDSCRLFACPSRLTGHSFNSSENLCLAYRNTKVVAPLQLGEERRDAKKCSLAKPFLISENGFKRPLSASEIELSEDYTCVISHGPNPKTTHIYGDCILECPPNNLSSSGNEMKDELVYPVKSLEISPSYSSSDFLSFCYSCHKKLEEGKDIYIYRGEKAFCSLICRSQEILIDEELEKTVEKTSENSPKSEANHEDLFGISIGGFA